MIHTVYLSLGTNLGNRLGNLDKAIKALSPGVQPIVCSRIYETEPWGYSDQPAFLNQVIKAETDLEPLALLSYLKSLEKRLGRKKTFLYGPRCIDLDILFYDDLVMETRDLSIPHAHLAERAFVLVPLSELEPDLHHPVSGLTVHAMLEALDAGSVKLYRDDS